jgi:hypothetical protein
MGDDSTPPNSHYEVGDDVQRASGAGDEGHTADGGVERPKVVIVDVVGEKAANAKTKFAADQ